MAATTRRPGLITVLVVIAVLAGIGSLLSGIVAITASGTGAGVVAIVIGLVYLGVAKGLLDGRNWARVTAAVVAAGNVLLAVATMVNSGNSGNSGTGQGAVVSAVFGLILLGILFSPKANAFFGSRSAASRTA